MGLFLTNQKCISMDVWVKTDFGGFRKVPRISFITQQNLKKRVVFVLGTLGLSTYTDIH